MKCLEWKQQVAERENRAPFIIFIIMICKITNMIHNPPGTLRDQPNQGGTFVSSDCLDKLEQVFILLKSSLCFQFHFFSKSTNFKILRDMIPRDCWPIGPGEGHWYGGGERLVRFSSSDFQLNFAKDRSKSHFHPLSSSRIAVVVE